MHRRLLLLVVLAAAALAVTASPAGAQNGFFFSAGCSLDTGLSPANEVRTPANMNDPTVESVASGRTRILILPGGLIIFMTRIDNPASEAFILGHIHEGPPTANGPVRVTLLETPTAPTRSSLIHQLAITRTSPAQAAAICANPQNYYVNYHTTQDPVGAIRGQLG